MRSRSGKWDGDANEIVLSRIFFLQLNSIHDYLWAEVANKISYWTLFQSFSPQMCSTSCTWGVCKASCGFDSCSTYLWHFIVLWLCLQWYNESRVVQNIGFNSCTKSFGSSSRNDHVGINCWLTSLQLATLIKFCNTLKLQKIIISKRGDKEIGKNLHQPHDHTMVKLFAIIVLTWIMYIMERNMYMSFIKCTKKSSEMTLSMKFYLWN